MMKRSLVCVPVLVLAMGHCSGAIAAGPPADAAAAAAARQRVVDHWTPERRAAATPRDLFLDPHGKAYMRRADGALIAYGRAGGDQLSASNPVPAARPGGGGGGGSDATPPSISGMAPADGATIAASATFSAVITDASGIRSVSFVVTYPDGVTTQSFTPTFVGNDTWETNLQGFSDGQWSWQVVAKDAAKGGGNTATSAPSGFAVDTGGGGSGGGGGGGGSYITTNAGWVGGGVVQTAAGRIYFEMPGNPKRKGGWSGYVCSGTVATDATSGRSVILTAAHCVYDDANKAFARNVLFIPNQDATTGTGTDRDCSNDPLGCWVPSFGAVDVNWTTRTFPDNVAWDYAFYVVRDSGAHSGTSAGSEVLDVAVTPMAISFATPAYDDGDPSATSVDFTHALGYSYSDDPTFMYCAEDMTLEGTVNWWLPSCGLSGGASGGPWVQPMSGGDGPLISVNSWGYTTAPGMAGPKFSGTSTECVFGEARGVDFLAVPTTDGDAGIAVSCP
ncbi:MAG: hypothetical protein PHP86_03745 [Nevskiales bacterium]|nr:hypothetical protein [Nevskiales bacterium]